MLEPQATGTFALRFQIGERTLAGFGLQVQTFASKLGAPVQPPPDPATLLPAGSEAIDGVLLRAIPWEDGEPALKTDAAWLRYVVQTYKHCYIDMQQSFDDYRAKFSAKTRSTITRKVKKWAEHSGGELRWKTYKTSEELRRFHPLARSVSALTYQERLLTAGLPDDAGFIEQMARDADADRARGYILYYDDRPVSYLYCPIVDDAAIYAYLGYDPAYMKHSVGTVLQWLALEDLFAERRVRFFDFTEGETDHKRLFATHILSAANVLFVRNTMRLWLLVSAHRRFNSWVAGMRELTVRWGWHTALRRWQRFGLKGGSEAT